MHEVLVNRLGGLSLPGKSVVRLTDRPDMTLDVYRGRKTTTQQQQSVWETAVHLAVAGGVFDGVFFCCPFFPLVILDEIWEVIESVSEGFLVKIVAFLYFTSFDKSGILFLFQCLLPPPPPSPTTNKIKFRFFVKFTH